MHRASRVLNFCTGGSIHETFCSRTFRHWASGYWYANIAAPLLDGVFYRMLGEREHVFNSYLKGKRWES